MYKRLSCSNYLVFLHFVHPDSMQGIPTAVRKNTLFMHVGAPTHFAIAMRNHLDSTYIGRWIGSGGNIAWPSSFPNFISLDFLFWDHVKSVVYLLTAWPSSLQHTSPAHRVCLKASGNPLSVCVGCSMIFSAATLNNFYKNGSSSLFWRFIVMYCNPALR